MLLVFPAFLLHRVTPITKGMRHVIVGREKIAGREDVGALRLRMIGAKNVNLAKLPDLGPGEKNEAVVLELDYSVLIPRRQTT
jgi:2-methylfumaryl-CoA hydratase